MKQDKKLLLNEPGNIYCLILSKYRLYQGIALYYSLMKTAKDVQLAVLCMDEETQLILSFLGLENVTEFPLEIVLGPNEINLRQGRNINEFCWMLKPVFLEYLLANYNNIKRVTYLDADLFFFSDVKKVFDEESHSSILLSRHDISPEFKFVEVHCGRFNSGFVSFKRDNNALNALSWWNNKCMTWCYDKLELNLFGDQKYLESFPVLFNKVGVIKTPGVNIAPWNQSQYGFSSKDDELYVNNQKLICYHFSGFRLLGKNVFAITRDFNVNLLPLLYIPYLNALKQAAEEIKKIRPEFNGYFIEEKRKQHARIYDEENLCKI